MVMFKYNKDIYGFHPNFEFEYQNIVLGVYLIHFKLSFLKINSSISFKFGE
jgi:hypothetical protein